MRKNGNLLGSLMLLLCAFIWGTSFVAQSEAMNSMGPLTFQAARSFLGGAVLLPVIFCYSAVRKRRTADCKETPEVKKKTLWVGVLCGIVLCTASLLQQYGIAMGTSGGKAGFITALYIILVPIAGVLFFKKRVHPALWACVGAAVVGLWLICIKGDFTLEISDLLVIGCSFVFCLHIILIDRFSPGLDGIKVSCIQFFTAAVISLIGALIFEKPEISHLTDGWFSLFYAGVLSSGVAYTLQILGQQRTEPTAASLLMSLESVFAVVGTVGISIISGAPQFPSLRETIGCLIMFGAIIAAQLLPKVRERS